jgi:hypothetical protein
MITKPMVLGCADAYHRTIFYSSQQLGTKTRVEGFEARNRWFQPCESVGITPCGEASWAEVLPESESSNYFQPE